MKMKTVLTALVLTFVGCGEAAHETKAESKEQEDATGTLSLKLTSADSDGRAYRLRNAVFNVYGYAFDIPAPISDAGGEGYSAVISSEDDLNAPIISLKLVPGYYDVILTNSDWYLERRVEGVWERVEQAVLLTSTYQSAYVYDQGVSTVNFRFGVDGELIDFRAGDLQIGISIEQPGEGAPDAGFIGGGTFGGGLPGGGTFGGGTFGGGTFGGGALDAGVVVP